MQGMSGRERKGKSKEEREVKGKEKWEIKGRKKGTEKKKTSFLCFYIKYLRMSKKYITFALAKVRGEH